MELALSKLTKKGNTKGCDGCLFNIEYLVIIMFVTVTKKMEVNVTGDGM
jgi:hypothetical protein